MPAQPCFLPLTSLATSPHPPPSCLDLAQPYVTSCACSVLCLAALHRRLLGWSPCAHRGMLGRLTLPPTTVVVMWAAVR